MDTTLLKRGHCVPFAIESGSGAEVGGGNGGVFYCELQMIYGFRDFRRGGLADRYSNPICGC